MEMSISGSGSAFQYPRPQNGSISSTQAHINMFMLGRSSSSTMQPSLLCALGICLDQDLSRAPMLDDSPGYGLPHQRPSHCNIQGSIGAIPHVLEIISSSTGNGLVLEKL